MEFSRTGLLSDNFDIRQLESDNKIKNPEKSNLTLPLFGGIIDLSKEREVYAMSFAMIKEFLILELQNDVTALKGWLNNHYVLEDTTKAKLLENTICYMQGTTSFATALGLDENEVDEIYATYRQKAQDVYDESVKGENK